MSCGGRCPAQSATANATKENVRAISGIRSQYTLEVALTRLAGLCLLTESKSGRAVRESALPEESMVDRFLAKNIRLENADSADRIRWSQG